MAPGNLIPSNSERDAASPDSVNKFVLSLDLKITRMTASLTAGGSWCQNEGEREEEKSLVSRGFLLVLFSLSEKLEDAGLFHAEKGV